MVEKTNMGRYHVFSEKQLAYFSGFYWQCIEGKIRIPESLLMVSYRVSDGLGLSGNMRATMAAPITLNTSFLHSYVTCNMNRE